MAINWIHVFDKWKYCSYTYISTLIFFCSWHSNWVQISHSNGPKHTTHSSAHKQLPINLTEWCWNFDYDNYEAREMIFLCVADAVAAVHSMNLFQLYKNTVAVWKFTTEEYLVSQAGKKRRKWKFLHMQKDKTPPFSVFSGRY